MHSHTLVTYITRCIAFSILAFGAVAASLAAPDKELCDAMDTPYKRAECKHTGVTRQLEAMVGIFENTNSPLNAQLTPGQLGQMKSAKSKAVRARGKNREESFKSLARSEAKSNRNSCHFVPLYDDVLQNGICDVDLGEVCAAIEVDAGGNPQACNPNKKNKGKGSQGNGKFDGLECDQTCDTELVTTQESLEMEAEAVIMEYAYDSLETDLKEMNEDLEALDQVLSASPVMNSAQATSVECGSVSTLPAGLEEAATALNIAAVTARGIAGISGAGCDQTAVALGFGGNGSAVCMVFESAAMALEVSFVVIDEILKAKTSELQSSTFACLQAVNGNIEDGFAQMSSEHGSIKANDDQNTAMIMNRIEQVREELVNLLNTPQGQRAYFPLK